MIVIACVDAAILDVCLTRLLHPSPVLAVLLFIGRSAGALIVLLALIVVLLAYLYYSSVSFLFGIVVDSLLRDEIRKGKRRRNGSGQAPSGRRGNSGRQPGAPSSARCSSR